MPKFIKLALDNDISIDFNSLHQFYDTYFAYYKSLDKKHQTIFVTRSYKFLNSKIIEGVNGFVPDNRVKALVAASAIQLTLGLEDWELDYFDIIILHAKDFDSDTGLKYSGETSLNGYVQLSWKSFLRGYTIKDDNINLGLHEFTHALRFNDVKGHGQDYFIEYFFENWLASAYPVFNAVKAGKSNVFRPYGGTNINEFLSVCVEHFFESPQQIKDNYPMLYYSTACLLNQLPDKDNTKLNVRKEMFVEKGKLMPGFKSTSFKSSFSQSLIVLTGPLLFTIYSTGITSATSLSMLILYLLLYLRYDYRYTRLLLRGSEFELVKGYLLFRKRRVIVTSIACLISFRKDNQSEKENYQIIYYHPEAGYFFEENLFVHKTESDSLPEELKINRVTYYPG